MSGFTLLEVMVALAILSVALLGLLQARSNAVTTAEGAMDVRIVTTLTEAKIEQIASMPDPTESPRSGWFEGHPGVRWEAEIERMFQPLATDVVPRNQSGRPWPGVTGEGVAYYRVAVTTTWPRDHRADTEPGSLTVETRCMPPDPSPEDVRREFLERVGSGRMGGRR